MTDQIGKQRGETLAAGAAGPVGRRISVRAKLYTAFIALGALVAVSAAVSISAFIRVDRALNEIAEESVPLALAAMDLSRKAERIVAAAPALLAVESAEAQASLSTSLGEDVDALEKLLATLERRRIGAQPVASIRRAVGQLQALDGARGRAKGFDPVHIQLHEHVALHVSVQLARFHGQVDEHVGDDGLAQIEVVLGVHRQADVAQDVLNLGLGVGQGADAEAVVVALEPALLERLIGQAQACALIEEPTDAP